MPTSSEVKVTMLCEFSGPFKPHDIHELAKGELAIRFPLVKRDSFRPASKTFQTPAEVDIRSRSDFVFAASTKFYFPDNIRTVSEDHSLPGISDNLLLLCRCNSSGSKSNFLATFIYCFKEPMELADVPADNGTNINSL